MYKRERVNEVELNMQIKSAAMAECSNINQIFCSLSFFVLLLSDLLLLTQYHYSLKERDRNTQRQARFILECTHLPSLGY